MKLDIINKQSILSFITLVLLSVLLGACSSVTEEKVEEKIDVNQGLDTIKSVESIPVVDSKVEVPKSYLYIIQIGAYSTFEKAKKFRGSIKNKINEEIFVSFDKRTSLYVVRLKPRDSRADAEEIRTKLRATKEFADAFILTIEI
ncbi:MAG: SPOR domain-containing protein [Ignavibacteriales bacterium]|nr:SPOR domain-containing protein [Ignavibacteriales bacterium]